MKEIISFRELKEEQTRKRTPEVAFTSIQANGGSIKTVFPKKIYSKVEEPKSLLKGSKDLMWIYSNNKIQAKAITEQLFRDEMPFIIVIPLGVKLDEKTTLKLQKDYNKILQIDNETS
jgi:hypothetical protein